MKKSLRYFDQGKRLTLPGIVSHRCFETTTEIDFLSRRAHVSCYVSDFWIFSDVGLIDVFSIK